MSELREFADMEASFQAAVHLLDGAVERADAALARQGIEIIDRSNRSGFDHSGFPSYIWEHDFRHRGALERCVLLEARARWAEPVALAELPGQVKVHASVVVFHPGQTPPLFASHPFSRDVPLDACANGGLLELIQAGLREATGALPPEYRDRAALR
jgi:hypothetical protein